MSQNDTPKNKRNTSEQVSHFLDSFESLSADDQERQLIIEPEYENLKDEIVQPDRVTMQTWYFWENWAPLLGPVATAVYCRLRMHGYYNRQTKELRETFHLTQSKLAREVGIKSPKTLRSALRLLENHGLLTRKKNYRYDPELRKKVRSTDLYKVKMTDPLTPEGRKKAMRIIMDDLESKHPESIENKGDSPNGKIYPKVDETPTPPKGKIYPYTTDRVDNSRPKGRIDPAYSADKSTQHLSNTFRDTTNVNNVHVRKGSQNLKDHPLVQRLTSEEKVRKEALAIEIGDSLNTMAGDRSNTAHKSRGFHKRVAFIMPAQLIHQALAATRDAVDDTRAGRKTLKKDPAAYFAGIIREIEEREHIDLGVAWKPETAAT